jgi:YidC/Oxa1 family membrane protein insertase
MYPYLQPKDDNPDFLLGQSLWTFDGKRKLADDVHEVRYFTTLPEADKIKIVKIYRLAPKEYHVTLVLEIHDTRDPKGADQEVKPFRYQLTGGQGLPIEGEWYTAIFRNAIIGMVDARGSLWRKLEESARISPHRGGDRFPEGSRGDSRMQYAGVANQYFASMLVVDDRQPKKDDGGVDADKVLAWARPTLETHEIRGIITKIFKEDDAILFTDFSDLKKSTTTKYFLLPRTKTHLEDLELNEGVKAVLSYYETDSGKRVASWVRLGETPKPQFDDITVRVNSEVIDLSPGMIRKHQFMLYHGPVKVALLGQFTGEEVVPTDLIEQYTDKLHLRTMTDYRSDNPFGWVSSKIYLTDLIILFTRLMHWLLNILHNLISWVPGSYGLSIVILTVMVRGCMFPISRKQAMFSIKMQELAPELKKLQEKYPDDPAAKMQAQQEFYRKHGINPLGSCWPVFLQMPIFLGLYFALQESIHFRLAGFMWIENLAAPDMLVYWSENIPVISAPDTGSGILGALYLGPYLNILPMIAVVFMMIQQMQTMPPPTDDQQAMQQKMLKFMSIFFGIMFYKVAAGLCIYFIASSLWGMAERKLLPKKKPAAEFAGTAPAGGAPVPAVVPKMKSKWDKKDKNNKNKDLNKDQEAITTIDKIKALWRDILKQAEKK